MKIEEEGQEETDSLKRQESWKREERKEKKEGEDQIFIPWRSIT